MPLSSPPFLLEVPLRADGFAVASAFNDTGLHSFEAVPEAIFHSRFQSDDDSTAAAAAAQGAGGHSSSSAAQSQSASCC